LKNQKKRGAQESKKKTCKNGTGSVATGGPVLSRGKKNTPGQRKGGQNTHPPRREEGNGKNRASHSWGGRVHPPVTWIGD